ncbi:MAG: PEP-CTERM system TPR-repeat protein PrsT [Gammaproteobacteria bacterium]|nr:PEP-CTERM system TPR-repeat protein PrsT [Gammaproteobacteria bacterium]
MTRSNRTTLYGVALLSACLLLTGCSDDPAAEARAHMAKAERFRAAGDLNAVVIEYKNALQAQPDNAEARWRLGQTYLALGQSAPAVKELERALPLAREQPQIVLELVRARLLKGEFDKALADLAGYRGERNAEVLALEGQAKMGLGATDEARALLQNAADEDPEAAEARLGLARLALSQRDLEGAEQEIEAALAADPANLDALLLKGDLALARGRIDDAATTFRTALESAPGNPGALAGLAQAQLARQELDAAAATIAQVAKAAPGAPMTRFLQGVLAYSHEDWEQAKNAFMEVLNVMPSHAQSMLLLGHATYMRGEYQQAEEVLRRFDTAFPHHPQAVKLLASVLLRLDRPKEAVAMLESLEDNGAEQDAGYLALMSYAQYAAGDAAKGREYIEKAQALAPDSALLQTQRAVGDLASGQLDAAIAGLQAATEAAPELAQARTLLTYAHLRRGDHQAALDAARALVEQHPDDALSHNLLGAALATAGNGDEARAAFERALALDPKFTPALLNEGALALQEKDLDTARQRYQAVLKINDGNTAALLGLARIADREGDMPGAIAWVEQAAKSNPKAVEPRLILAQTYLRNGDIPRALVLAQEASDIAPKAPQSRFLLGQAQLASNRPDLAYETFSALQKDRPDAVGVTLKLAHAARATGKLDEARSAYRKVLDQTPGTLEALWGLFALEVGKRDFDAARALAGQMREQQPERADADVALGDLASAQGQYTEAAAAYQAALTRAANPLVVIKRSQAQRQSGDSAGARSTLADWVQAHPDDIGVQMALAMSDQQSGDDARAIEQYEATLQKSPDNPVVLNNLAWLYDQKGDKRAVEVAERAYRTAPKSPEIADTYGWILVRHGKVERGTQLLEKAAEQMPGNPDIQYHLAASLARVGQDERAKKILGALLDDDTPFSERAEAEKLLADLQ